MAAFRLRKTTGGSTLRGGDALRVQTANATVTPATIATTVAVPVTGVGQRETLDLPLLYPTGDGTVTNVVDEAGGTTSLWSKVDEPPGASDQDTTYIVNAGNSQDASVFFDVTDMPADFRAAIQITVAIEDKGVGVAVDDTLTLHAQFFAADETTALTDEKQLDSFANATAIYSSTEQALVVDGHRASTWDGAKLRLRWDYTQNGTGENLQIRITAVECDLSYLSQRDGHVQSATVISATAALPAASLSTGWTATPATTVTTVAAPAASPSTGWTPNPATIATTVAVPAASTSTGATASPATTACTVSFPTPTITTNTSTTVTPNTFATTVAAPAAAANTGWTAEPATIETTVVFPAAREAPDRFAPPRLRRPVQYPRFIHRTGRRRLLVTISHRWRTLELRATSRTRHPVAGRTRPAAVIVTPRTRYPVAARCNATVVAARTPRNIQMRHNRHLTRFHTQESRRRIQAADDELLELAAHLL